MMRPAMEDKELASWKEIAEYLGVSVRTAQKWEQKRNLPIHRLPGKRSTVIAFASELDSWKRSLPVGKDGNCGDGKTETLFNLSSPEATESWALVCLSETDQEKLRGIRYLKKPPRTSTENRRRR
jgi:excisionase family DNA binding protein